MSTKLLDASSAALEANEEDQIKRISNRVPERFTVLRELMKPRLQIHKSFLELDRGQAASENPRLNYIDASNTFSQILYCNRVISSEGGPAGLSRRNMPAPRSKRVVKKVPC